MMGCWTRFGRFVLIVLNAIFMVVSLNVIALGIMLTYFSDVLMDFAEADNGTQSDFNIPPLAMVTEMPFIDQAGMAVLIFGCIMFVLSFLPCCGASCSWRPLLVLFVVLMSVLVLCEAVVGGLFLDKNSALHSTIKDTVGDKVKKDYVPDGDDPFSFSINFLNYVMECCGIRGWEDFPYNDLPPSCCNRTIVDGDDANWGWARNLCVDQPFLVPDQFYNAEGCYTVLQDTVLSDFTMSAVILSVALTLQLLEIVFACMLVRDLKAANKVDAMYG